MDPHRPSILLLAAALAAGCAAQADRAVHEQVAAAERVAPALVRVQYTLRYDHGEEPQTGGWVSANCPAYSAGYVGNGSPLGDERPLELPGFLVGPTTVVTPDPMIHPRFIERTAVRFADETVAAKPSAWAKDKSAVMLELDKPLPQACPLEFKADAPGPLAAVEYVQAPGEWTVSVSPFGGAVVVSDAEGPYLPGASQSLITTADGTPVGIAMSERLPTDGSWKGSPLQWPAWTAAERDALLERLGATAERALVRVTLTFRSPRKQAGGGRYYRSDDADPEMHVAGVVLEDGRVLVLVELKPNVTARLEGIVVHPASGGAAPAKFACSLADYGALVAVLEKPLSGGVPLAPALTLGLRGRLMPCAEVRLRGDQRAVYYAHRRIMAFELGWRERLHPCVPGDDENLFLFDTDGRLVALPVSRRQRAGTENRWSSGGDTSLTAAADLAGALAAPDCADAGNVPLPEEDEARLAWLGVILQGLTRDLARENGVAELTQDGESGALVSYVYPDSPAAKAGIQQGQILVRLRVADRPKPVDIRVERDDDRGPFPWDRLDEIPEQYYDRIPGPWPPAQDGLARLLTDLGFGKAFELDVFADGKLEARRFVVEAGPPHYDSAPRYKAEGLGLTVRDLTYEVRRYFQKDADDPGVIVSKIEPGSKASVAGIKPYELIVGVNDRPVMTVKDFAEAVESGDGQLRLTVKRMTQGRVVKMSLAPAPAPAPGSPAAPPEGSAEPEGDVEM
jgi:hypothetical protein